MISLTEKKEIAKAWRWNELAAKYGNNRKIILATMEMEGYDVENYKTKDDLTEDEKEVAKARRWSRLMCLYGNRRLKVLAMMEKEGYDVENYKSSVDKYITV